MKVSEVRALAISFSEPKGQKGKIRLVYRAEGIEGIKALANLWRYKRKQGNGFRTSQDRMFERVPEKTP